jgi:hypothetical protein
LTGESKSKILGASDRPAGESNPHQPTSAANDVLRIARELLEQGRSDEALAAIEQYAADSSVEPTLPDESEPIFDGAVTDQELELAFESAESDPEQMLDVDEIAERAIRQADTELPAPDVEPAAQEDFVELGASYATRTVAKLLERQGDAPAASRIRAIVNSSEDDTATAEGSVPDSTVSLKPPVRDRRTATIMELERWLVNLRGVAQ